MTKNLKTKLGILGASFIVATFPYPIGNQEVKAKVYGRDNTSQNQTQYQPRDSIVTPESIIFEKPFIGKKDSTDYIPTKEIRNYLAKALAVTNLPPLLQNIESLEKWVLKESSGNRLAYFPGTGARGLTQQTEEAWTQINGGGWKEYIENVFNPEKNILTGVKYLKWGYDFCRTNHKNWNNLSNKEKLEMVFGVYNEGPGELRGNDWNRQNPKYTQGVI